MLRLTELKLPLGHEPEAIRAAVLERLGVPDADLLELAVVRRRATTRAEVGDPDGLFRRRRPCGTRRRCWRGSPATRGSSRRRTPTTSPSPARRTGLSAAAGDRRGALRPVRRSDPGPDGLSPDHPRSRQGRPRADQGHLGPVAARRAESGIQRPVRRGRRRHLLRRQALQPDQGPAAPGPQGADRVRQGRRAAGNPDRGASAHRHLPAGDHGREPEADQSRRWAANTASKAGSTTSWSRPRRTDRAGSRASCCRTARPSMADQVVLALGHSARDTFAMLQARGVHIEAKPFSIGFRIEHPQGMVDRARFGPSAGHPDLGAADYALSHHCSNGRTVYSFCMCPGGTVVAAASEPGRRGDQRHEPVFAQRAKRQRRHRGGDHARGGLSRRSAGRRGLQRRWEEAGLPRRRRSYAAAGQRVGDFLAGRPSTALGEVRPVLPARRHARPTCPPACPTTPSRRSARPCRCSAARCRASTARTPS